MNLVITEHLAQAIRDAVGTDYRDKRAAAQSVNLLTASAADVERIKSEYETAKAQYESVKDLKPGTNATVDGGVLKWDVRVDNRPVGWEHEFAYRVPSRNNGRAHEITVSWVGGLNYSCNCDGSKFGEKCWAVKAISSGDGLPNIKSKVSNGYQYTYVIDEKGIEHPVTRLWPNQRSPDFGLIKE